MPQKVALRIHSLIRPATLQQKLIARITTGSIITDGHTLRGANQEATGHGGTRNHPHGQVTWTDSVGEQQTCGANRRTGNLAETVRNNGTGGLKPRNETVAKAYCERKQKVGQTTRRAIRYERRQKRTNQRGNDAQSRQRQQLLEGREPWAPQSRTSRHGKSEISRKVEVEGRNAIGCSIEEPELTAGRKWQASRNTDDEKGTRE